MTGKIKVYELAKELGLDSQALVDAVQRLGIDIKTTTSVLGTEEVRTVRDYFRKNRPMAKTAAPAAAAPKSPVTEKRVGATVIRRRAVDKAPAPAEVKQAAPIAERVTPRPPVQAPLTPPPAPVEAEEPEEDTIATAPEPADEPSMAPTDVEAVPSQPETLAEAADSAPAEEPQAPAAPERPAATASPGPTAAPTTVAAKPAAPEKKPLKRAYPSIIKKISTEQHLGEVIGPKVEKKERPKPATPAPGAAKPRTTTPGTTGTGLAGGLRRVKEVEVAPVPVDAAKEATRRRTMQRQDSVFRSADYLKRELVHATKKKKNAIARPAMKTQITKAAAHKRVVEMGDTITVSDLAHEMSVKAAAVIGKLMGMGVMASMNQSIDYDTATLVAHEFGYEVKQKVFKEEDFIPTVDTSPENLQTRAPVVTIMGHVDHGKTSLLDAIRKTNVAGGEAGGITQHVGAYTVQIPKGKVTFIDTPGHEAFTAMRARGAKVTDIVVVVVSAVDGVMPQTLESINHAKAAEVPIIVAINKVDLPDGNPDRIKQTLAGHDLSPEEWGGDTIYVPVSAKTGKGIEQLLESILLQAEILELKANFDAPARGSVVESKLDKNRGPLATLLVQHGRLRPGDIVVCGATFGKVRAMADSYGKRVTEAEPGDPVEVLGLPEVPTVGDEFFVMADEKAARDLTAQRVEKVREKTIERPKLSLEEMMTAATGTEKELRVILKADVQGSVEALKEALTKFPTDKVKLKLLHAATGGVVESDVNLASASKAVILGFNIRPDIKAQKLAEAERVEVRTYSIIYDLLEDVKKLLTGMLDATVKERVIGRAEVREVFTVPKVGVIAGSAVIDGKVQRGCYLRLLRDSRVIYEGKLASLRRFKEDVKEVAQGYECGIGLENFNDVKLGDQFEAFLKEEVKGTL